MTLHLNPLVAVLSCSPLFLLGGGDLCSLSSAKAVFSSLFVTAFFQETDVDLEA